MLQQLPIDRQTLKEPSQPGTTISLELLLANSPKQTRAQQTQRQEYQEGEAQIAVVTRTMRERIETDRDAKEPTSVMVDKAEMETGIGTATLKAERQGVSVEKREKKKQKTLSQM